MWRRFIRPTASGEGFERRRARLLSWLLASMMALGVYAAALLLLATRLENALRTAIIPILAAAFVLLLVAYALNRAGQYRIAAVVTIGLSAVGSWAAAFAGAAVLAPSLAFPLLYFVLVSVVLSSVLLSARATAVLSLLQMAGIIYARSFVPTFQAGFVTPVEIFAAFLCVVLVVSAAIRERDLAQLDQQTREIVDSEERLRLLFEKMPDSVMMIDPYDPVLPWAIVECNDASCRLSGYARDQLIGQPLDILHDVKITPAQREEYLDQLARGRTLHFETTYRRQDGATFPVESTTSLIATQGRRLALRIDRDVTERKPAQAALAEERRLLRALVDNLPDYVYVKDAEGRFILGNLAFARLLGAHSPDQLIGKTDHDFLPPAEAEEQRANERAFMRSEQVVLNKEEAVSDSTGTSRWVLTTKVLLRDSYGKPSGIVGIGRDITERREAEESQRQVNEQLKRWLAELEQRTHEMGQLNEMSDLLQTCLTVEEAYSVIGSMIRQFFPDESGMLCVISASRNIVEEVASWGVRGGEAPAHVFAPDDCWALRRGRLHVVNDVAAIGGGHRESAILCKHVHPPWPAAYMCMPMVAQGEALGLMYLQTAAPDPALGDAAPRELSEAQQQLARTVTDCIALALANLKLRESLRDQSIRDPLTGLYNRRYMEESLEREVRRAARSKHTLGIIMLDLDHFKRFNDAFGHQAGDALLRELGSHLRTCVRGEDIACRYGGEEFTLIMPDANLDVSLKRAQRLREDIKHLDLEHRGQTVGAITLSLGVAAFPDHGSTGEAVLSAADAALYRAKREGRDRVAVAE